MRTVRMAAIALALGVAAAAVAQTANVYLDVKRKASVKDSTTRARGYYYSDKDYSRSVDLAVTVKNMSQEPVTFDLEYYFVAKTVNGNVRWIYDSGTQSVVLGKAAHTNFTTTSKELQASKTESWRYKEETGSKYEGHIYRAVMAKKVIVVNASTRPLESAGRSESELAALIGAAEQGLKQTRDGGLNR
ncbi:MAG: hypothetical protein KJ579_11240 [Verrucomicrobia bacterium]|nr:hypothetical protein [Verrucomicrobiota bacterium]